VVRSFTHSHRSKILTRANASPFELVVRNAVELRNEPRFGSSRTRRQGPIFSADNFHFPIGTVDVEQCEPHPDFFVAGTRDSDFAHLGRGPRALLRRLLWRRLRVLFQAALKGFQNIHNGRHFGLLYGRGYAEGGYIGLERLEKE
jgi:hypothetical protein